MCGRLTKLSLVSERASRPLARARLRAARRSRFRDRFTYFLTRNGGRTVPGEGANARARRKRDKMYTGPDVFMPSRRQASCPSSCQEILVHFFSGREPGWRPAIRAALPGSPDNRRRPLHGAQPSTLEEESRGFQFNGLFKFGSFRRRDATFSKSLPETVSEMIASWELVQTPSTATCRVGPGHDGLDGRGWKKIAFFYVNASTRARSRWLSRRRARGLPGSQGATARRSLVKRALGRAEKRMFLAGEIEAGPERSAARWKMLSVLRRPGLILALRRETHRDLSLPLVRCASIESENLGRYFHG